MGRVSTGLNQSQMLKGPPYYHQHLLVPGVSGKAPVSVTNNTPNFDLSRSKRSIERLKIIAPNDEIQALKAAVPRFDNPKKTEYLVLRSVSFSHEECLKLLDSSSAEYSGWLSEADEFGVWAVGSGMLHLQQGVGEGVLRAKFLRNVYMQLHIDSRVMTLKAMELPMTEDEKLDARDASKRYSAQNIVAMMRALDGDEGEGVTAPQVINIQIDVDHETAQRYGDKKIMSQHLLEKFTKKNVVLDETGRVIEG